MGPLVAAILVMLLVPVLLQLTGRIKSADKLLQISFLEQTALVDGMQVSASRLSVLHRWPNNAMRIRQGVFIQIDANWLFRTEGGQFVVAIAQGTRDADEGILVSWNPTQLQITWIWRTLSEAQVRAMLAGERKVYRKVFGTGSP